MAEIMVLAKKVKALFHRYQVREPLNDVEAFDEAQIAIANLIQALNGIVPEEQIIEAVGDAKSENEVSRAGRSRLPPL